ncbi:MAG TPA: PAS domain-containing protein, partial [Candidatus Kapabacteria bacterium]|nr:PAS domain-containing protein [Candidatus Kapabacteria bacterium]
MSKSKSEKIPSMAIEQPIRTDFSLNPEPSEHRSALFSVESNVNILAFEQFSGPFSTLLDELGMAVILSDNSGKILRANKSAVRILGIPEEVLTSLKHDDPIWQAILEDGTAVPVSDLPGVRALREGRAIAGLEFGIVRPDGKLTWILESAAPLRNEQGAITGVIVTFPEVTSTVKQRQALKDLSDKFQRERDRANEANRLK